MFQHHLQQLGNVRTMFRANNPQRFLLLGLILLIFGTACSPLYDTRYTFTPPASAEGTVCATQCAVTESYCRQSCQLNQNACEQQARADAARDFDVYVYEQKRKNRPIKKSLRDFERSYYCPSRTNCESTCAANQRACHQNCGGSISSERVCVAFCD